jgi:hypothetical protein
MAADNNLYHHALSDLIEMQRGLAQSNNVRIIVYIDHCSMRSDGMVQYLEIIPGGRRVLKAHGDEDSGSGETLTKFMDWAYSRYASERNVMVIWSHSDGWLRSVDGTRGIGFDDTSGTKIGVSTREFRNAFEDHGKRYDIIILDACETGALEMVTELEGFARYVIASPDLLLADGFPWTEIIRSWYASISARELSRRIISHIGDAYRVGGVYNNGAQDRRLSISVYSMDRLNDLIKAIQDFSIAFANPEYAEYFTQIRDTVFVYQPYGWPLEIDIDLYDFVSMIRENDMFDENQRAVIDALYNALNVFIVENVTLASSHRKAISIMYPLHHQSFVALNELHWTNLRLSRSNWNVFLSNAYALR